MQIRRQRSAKTRQRKTGIKHPHDEAEDAFYSVEEKK